MLVRLWLIALVFMLLAGIALSAEPSPAGSPASPAATPDQEKFFEEKVRPILAGRCLECHGAKKEESGLRLDSRQGALDGGDSGERAVVPGEPDRSLLVKAINHTGDVHMPPTEKLPPAQIEILTDWIRQGAPWPAGSSASLAQQGAADRAPTHRATHWAYQPISSPAPPQIRNPKSEIQNPIDAFVLARLEAAGLTASPQADRRTLIRRVTYDLIGLPPTPDEVEAFLAERAPDAYERLIDRLLASPHYGERWGRHWLDVVRYADTAGDNSDYPIPQMYRYRNWVIEAVNADMPYDRFIREQIAGDLLPADSFDARQRQIIATGYIANARRFGSRVDDYPQHLTIEDTIDNLGRAFLGHTLNCARCHNHKFDPITTEDYYAIYGIFHSTRYPWPGIELEKRQRDFVPLAPQEQVAAVLAVRTMQEDALTAEIKAAEEMKKAIDELVRAVETRLENLKKSGPPSPEELKTAESELEAEKKKAKETDEAVKAAKKKRDDFRAEPLPYEVAYAVAEGKKIENCKVQLKGDPERLGGEVVRRFPEVLGGQSLPPEEKGSGRLELAEWIASQDNPLTARVMVNRIWQHHFGRGLVATPNDFGKQGQQPSHPELLDWLAIRFIESGWSVKEMHRLILTSRTYQLASAERGTGSAEVEAPSSELRAPSSVDPSNTLLSHFPRRRLDAESIRDTLLVLGGNLDRTTGQAHPFPPQKDWDFTQHKPFKAVYDTNHRSVYLMTQRISRHPFLAIFDGPDTGASTASRITSTTTLQALYFLNDPLVHEQANRLAARLREAKGDDAERIDLAHQLLFARPATDEEKSLGEEYLKKVGDQGWESYIRVLLRTNEFVYLN